MTLVMSTSQLWGKDKVAGASECKSCQKHQKLNRSTTSSLWNHMKEQHGSNLAERSFGKLCVVGETAGRAQLCPSLSVPLMWWLCTTTYSRLF